MWSSLQYPKWHYLDMMASLCNSRFCQQNFTCSWMMSDSSFTISLKLPFRPSWYSNWSSLIKRSLMSSAMLQAWTKRLQIPKAEGQKMKIKVTFVTSELNNFDRLSHLQGSSGDKLRTNNLWWAPEYVFKILHFLAARLVGFAVIQKCSGISHWTCIHLQKNSPSVTELEAKWSKYSLHSFSWPA